MGCCHVEAARGYAAYREGWHVRWVGAADAVEVTGSAAPLGTHVPVLRHAMRGPTRATGSERTTVQRADAELRPNRIGMHHTARTPSQVPPVVACRRAVERVLLVDLGQANSWALSDVGKRCTGKEGTAPSIASALKVCQRPSPQLPIPRHGYPTITYTHCNVQHLKASPPRTLLPKREA